MENKEQTSNEVVKCKSKMSENDSRASESEDHEKDDEQDIETNTEPTNQNEMTESEES